MSCCEMRDASESRMPVVGESEMAEHLRTGGRRVVVHRGRHWEQVLPGFFRPVHPLARLSAREATRPTPRCWGFQACLVPGDAEHANAAIPTYLISNLDSFDEGMLSRNRRHELRKARKRVRFVEITTPTLLRDQGYEVLRSSHDRTGYGTMPTKAGYAAALDDFGAPASGLVLAGLVEGRLGGYITGYAVDGTAYIREVVLATEVLRTNISSALTYEFVYACKRTRTVKELVHGLHAREDESLSRYKEWLGFPIQFVPARVVMLPGVAAFIRRRSPHKYYRLTGRS